MTKMPLKDTRPSTKPTCAFLSPSLSRSLPNPTITTPNTTTTTADVDGDHRSRHDKALFSPMPAQKRSVSENLVSGGVDDDDEEERYEDSLHQHFHRKQPRHVEPDQVQPQDHHHQHPQLHQEEGYVSFLVFSLLFFFIWISLSLTIGSSDFYFPDSDENPSSSTEEKPEYFLSLSLSLSLSQSSSICLSICVAYVCELIDFGALGEFLDANVYVFGE